jgi:PHD/YefM family antitoxin component YafN of YafNO toxin-antitoxin module
MIQTPQIEPVTNMIRDHKSVLAKLKQGPVFLAQRSKPAAVLVAPALWDEMTAELARLRRMVEFDRQFAEMDAGNVVEFTITHAPA